MKAKLFTFLKLVVPIALGIYLVWHIYKQLTAEQRDALFEAMRNANYFWVFLSFCMGLLSHVIRGYRWSFQLEAMGYKSRQINNFLAVMIGYIVNMVLPRVGEMSRAAALSKYENVPFEKSFGSIISERAVDAVILIGITVLTVALQYEILQPFANQIFDAFSGKVTSILLWVILAIGIAAAILGIKLLDKYRDKPVVNKLWLLKQGLFEGLRSIVRMKARGAYLFATALIWMLYVGMFWVCFFSIDDTASMSANAVFASFVIGSFAIVIIPGGIGAFPVGIMQSLMLYGIAAETGFALGWILWLSQTTMIVLIGGVSMMLMPLINRDKSKNHVETPSPGK